MTITAATSIIDAALSYARAGLAPLRVWGLDAKGHCQCDRGGQCDSPGKHPVDKEWQKIATTDVSTVAATFRDWRGNIGVAMQEIYVLIDADGEVGVANAKRLFGNLPPTFEQVSGSGTGRHWVYRLGAEQTGLTDRPLKTSEGGKLKIDIKRRGYFVAAPSLHASGKHYSISRWAQPIALPDGIYKLILPPQAPMRVAMPAKDTVDVARARRYMAAIPGAVSGNGGHTDTFKAMCRLVGMGLDEADTWALALEYNERCDPPWSDKDLEHKLKSARASGRLAGPADRDPIKAVRRLDAMEHTAPAPAPAPKPSTPPPDLDPPEDDWEPPHEEPHEEAAVAVVPAGDQELSSKELHALGAEFSPTRSGDWKLTSALGNVAIILANDRQCPFKPRFNVFAQRLMSNDVQWSDLATTELRIWLQQRYGIKVNDGEARRIVDLVGSKNAYHPVRNWLTSLKWDGTSRINNWLQDYLSVAPSDFSRAAGRKWLISGVARIFEPGCKVDHVLLLKGTQGVGKTSALGQLASQEWYSDSPLEIGNKDAFQNLPGLWIVELGELASAYKAQQEMVKGFLTSRHDTYRPSFGHYSITVPRGCIFAATTNEDLPLRDSTGARRFWPVTTGAADVIGIGRAREQLWAEATEAYRSHEPWWFDRNDESRLASPEQEAFTEQDPREEMLAHWIASTTDHLTTSNILTNGLLIHPGNLRGNEGRWLGPIMRRLGYVYVAARQGNQSVHKVWKKAT